jgi:hypothetical protein
MQNSTGGAQVRKPGSGTKSPLWADSATALAQVERPLRLVLRRWRDRPTSADSGHTRDRNACLMAAIPGARANNGLVATMVQKVLMDRVSEQLGSSVRTTSMLRFERQWRSESQPSASPDWSPPFMRRRASLAVPELRRRKGRRRQAASSGQPASGHSFRRSGRSQLV